MATYSEYMRESSEWLKLAKLSESLLSGTAQQLTQALTQAKAKLRQELVDRCGDSPEQAASRISSGPSTVRARLATCSSARAAGQAAVQMSREAAAITIAAVKEMDDLERQLQQCGLTPAETAALRKKGRTSLIGARVNHCRKQRVPQSQAQQAAGPSSPPLLAPQPSSTVPWKPILIGGAVLTGAGVVAVLLLRR